MTMSRLRQSFILVLFVTSIVACGRDRQVVVLTEDAYPERYAEAVCGAAFRCCGTGAEFEDFFGVAFGTEDECRTELVARIERGRSALAPQVAGGTVFFDSGAASCMVSRRASASCGAEFLGAVRDCGEAYAGTKGLGDACEVTAECGPFENGWLACVGGNCEVGEREVGVGQLCDNSTDFCAGEGVFCEEGVCVARSPLPLGASCTSDRECASGWCGSSGRTCVAYCNGI